MSSGALRQQSSLSCLHKEGEATLGHERSSGWGGGLMSGGGEVKPPGRLRRVKSNGEALGRRHDRGTLPDYLRRKWPKIREQLWLNLQAAAGPRVKYRAGRWVRKLGYPRCWIASSSSPVAGVTAGLG